MMGRKISFFIIFFVLFLITSCNNYKKFFEQNRKDLQQLVSASLVQMEDKEIYCAEDNEFDSLITKMRDLGIDCIRKDTVEGTLNFVFKHKESLSSIEMVYQYNTAFDEPRSFPKAGEIVEKLSDKWFLRKIAFD